MIEVQNLTRTFPGVVALDNVSFRVGKGEIVGFLGPNGAGKTTAMRIITCFLPPTSGSVRVSDLDVLQDSIAVRRIVGYLPESNPLYTEMRVWEYLAYRGTIKGIRARDRRKRIEEVCERCGLKGRESQIIGTLSKGYRQRVGIADAILHNPEVLILDEPTIGLDPNQMREVRILIKELGKDHTILLSTHILSEVEKVCGRILIISHGAIVAEGTPQQIYDQIMKTGRLHLVARGDGRAIKDLLDKVPGVASTIWSQQGDLHTYLIDAKGRDATADVLRAAAEHSWDVVELGPEKLSLEDAFTMLTDGTRLVRREREMARG